MKRLVFAVFLIAGAFSKPYGVEEDDKIINGYTCLKNSIPYQVSLRTSTGHFCGGSLIADQWVLTSAQCYKSNIQIILGEHDITKDDFTEQVIDASRLIRHPYFSSRTMDNDIMLIKLAKKANLNSYVQTVDLPSGCVSYGRICQVSGWGSINNAYHSSLHCLDSPIVSDNECPYYQSGSMTYNMFCAGHLGESTTSKGDEGGPLVCQDQLQGIVSWGHSRYIYPWVYTKVCNYIDWIQRTMIIN